MEIAVIDIQGNDTGRKVNLADDVFNVDVSKHAIYLDVKQYLANQRQGTHKAKQRAEIVGSTRKIKKQKGTGTARAGSIKSGVFRGGGRIFGPVPRDYSFKLNKGQKKLARKSALSEKAQAGSVKILDGINMDQVSTKEFANVLKNLGLSSSKTLVVLGETNSNAYLSSRNLQKVDVIQNTELSTYKLLNAETVLLLENSIDFITDNLS